jgi:hypothetical protein
MVVSAPARFALSAIETRTIVQEWKKSQAIIAEWKQN